MRVPLKAAAFSCLPTSLRYSEGPAAIASAACPSIRGPCLRARTLLPDAMRALFKSALRMPKADTFSSVKRLMCDAMALPSEPRLPALDASLGDRFITHPNELLLRDEGDTAAQTLEGFALELCLEITLLLGKIHGVSWLEIAFQDSAHVWPPKRRSVIVTSTSTILRRTTSLDHAAISRRPDETHHLEGGGW